jgi:signal transduction histidine kinase
MEPDNSYELDARARDFSLRVLMMGVTIFAASFYLTPNRVEWYEILLLVLACLYGEWRSVKLPGYGILNPGEGFYVAAACLFGPLVGGGLAFGLGLLGDVRKKRAPNVVLFNMGWALTTFGIVGIVYPKLGLLGAGLSYLLVAGFLQAHGEKYFANLSLQETLRHQMKEMLLVAPAVFLFGYLTMTLLSIRSEAILFLLFPLELLVTYVKTRELSQNLQATLTKLELTQAELVATGRKAALGVMAAGIAHEINNPLAAAVTNVHMLKMLVTGPTAKPSLELLEKSVGRCQTIVGRMLKYSRQTAGGGVPCDLQEILADAQLFCGRKFGDGGTRLELEIQTLPRVLADPTELVQLLSNLLTNAHDAGPKSVVIGGQRKGGTLSLRIRDDGSGIPAEVRDKIFDPFFTTKAVGSGTGLGLSIAQGFARGFGGDLVLESTSERGTCFLLTLPVAE